MLPGANVASMAGRAAFLLALLLGLGFWTNLIAPSGAVVIIHMLLGLTLVGAVWYLGLAQAQRGGSLGLTLGTFFAGLIVAIFGLAQTALKGTLNVALVDIIHLLLALFAIGLGEMSARRIKAAQSPAI
ncbi:MAG TPA: hypothetical protein VGR57_15250 [Ktedonobacterales bacterium]|nr:hypothetical protein [Ktedonobacterales bacterium]